MRQPVVQTERHAAADDVGLRHRDQRRANAKAAAFDASLRRKPGEVLECLDELRPAIRIARVVERVHANEDVVRAEHFRPCQRQRQHDGIARRHIRRRNRVRRRAALRHLSVAEQRGTAERRQVDADFAMRLTSQRLRNVSRGENLVRVTLSVLHRQRVEVEPACRARSRPAV